MNTNYDREDALLDAFEKSQVENAEFKRELITERAELKATVAKLDLERDVLLTLLTILLMFQIIRVISIS